MSTQEQLLEALNTDHLHADLKGRSVRGGFVTLVSQVTHFLLQTVSTVVLARLLTPADFGIVAMVTAVTGLATAFADWGLSEATIQRRDITYDQVSALFWINAAIGLGLTLLTAALAPVLAWFYNEPHVRNITLVLSLIFVINSLRVQPFALLKRQMRFSAIATCVIASWCLAVPVGITMARRGFGYWAIVALPFTANFIQMALSWMMVNWRPSLPRRGANVGSLVAFGGNVAMSYIIFSINRSVDGILIGWYWGAGPLGLYSRAFNLLMLPVQQLNAPAASVAIPALSRIHGDQERYARYFLRAVNLVAWMSAPMFGFLFVAAKPVIVLTLGYQWREAAPIFQFLALSGLGQLLLQSTVWLLVSRGESDRLLKLLLTISPIIMGSFVIGLPFGPKGVALSSSLVLLSILPWTLKFAIHGTNLTLQCLGQAIRYPISLCLAGVFLAELALRLIAPQRMASQLLVAALGFAAAYSLSALIPPVREEAMSFRKLFSELRPSSQSV